MQTDMRTATRDGAAGVAATVAMSATMWLAQRVGLMGEQPPRKIARSGLKRAGQRSSRTTQRVTASLLHLGFGSSCGAVFGLLSRRLQLPAPAEVQGAAFGLAVWAVSYKGWVPALRIMAPPDRDRPGRPTAMIVAHLVYGTTLGRLIRMASA